MNRSGWKSDFKGRTNEVNLELGKRFYDGAWSLRPFVGIDVFATRLNGAEENGGAGLMNPGINYDRMNMTQVFVRPGFDLRFECNRFALNTGLSYSYDVRNPEFRTWVVSQDSSEVDATWLYGSKLGREVLSFNVGSSYQLGRSLTVFGGYDGRAVVDHTGGYQSIGYVGGSWKW